MHSLLLILRNRRYLAPAWVFASLNIIVGTWALYIPTVKEKLQLDDATLGLALLAFSIGLLVIIPLSSRIIATIGLGRVTLLGIITFGFAMIAPLVAPTFLILCLVLFGAGMLTSLTDIAMNALVSELEKEDDVNFMSAAHGFFSMGGVIGAGIGSLLIPLFAQPWQHALLISGFVLATNLLLSGSYRAARSPETDRGEGGFNLGLLRPLLGLALISFMIMGSEGAIEHWSKLYMLDIVKISSDQLAGFGFVAFSATMMLGRFLGDGISARIGPLKIIMGGTALAALGFLAVLAAEFWSALIGFALVGLGFSVIIPELFRLAGKTKGVSSSEGIALVAGLGYVGFLASPALLGFLSGMGTLRLSFTALLVVAVAAFVIAGVLLKRRRV
ncbi:MAG: MFS family permease [Neolewinella sp.]|jgi:MFS family permease